MNFCFWFDGFINFILTFFWFVLSSLVGVGVEGWFVWFQADFALWRPVQLQIFSHSLTMSACWNQQDPNWENIVLLESYLVSVMDAFIYFIFTSFVNVLSGLV